MFQNTKPSEVASIINTGDKHPNIIKAISRVLEVDSFTSSPCLLHDCLIFIGVSFVINSYIKIRLLNLTPIFITLITLHN